MNEPDMDKVRAFLDEYEALCRKHGMIVSAYTSRGDIPLVAYFPVPHTFPTVMQYQMYALHTNKPQMYPVSLPYQPSTSER